jgi:hypothetical protein
MSALKGEELQAKFDEHMEGASLYRIKPTTIPQAVAMMGPDMAVPESKQTADISTGPSAPKPPSFNA